ncbi:ATP-binding protein [Aurantiacibacter sp. MUD11]|uniref:sensor histidine kinase n=1 Tax=Aurantiacibacter sp. MUD11 TaxID=3003265 RepID=UPI0022A9F77F|nr:ATP-binding protein [Aurantiacibacter sp. MUD11]WAT16974.1 ATP-binding protein [Aurantiacibacter sp. MUD11]
MRRFLPKSLPPRSLLGQMLLSVALALLVAQTISAVLLYRAQQARNEFGAANALAFQLVAEPRIDIRVDADPSGDNPMRRRPRVLRMQYSETSPLLPGESSDDRRENLLRELLGNQGVDIADLVVTSRPVMDDPFVQRGLRNGTRWRGDEAWQRGELLVAGLRRTGEERWLIARIPMPVPEEGSLRGVILQTVILYLVLVGGLALLLRRITRPLAVLTRRVERFGGQQLEADPLPPSGPEDTRRLITAHNAMEARIAALLDEKDVMLGAIGHDLKTPLAALRVRIECVEDDIERERMADTIEDITNSLDDILSLARVGRPSDPLERTDLSALLASVVEEYEDMGRNVALGPTERVALPVRATWLRRALRNLISNALRYGQQARISLSKDDTHAILRIADKGPGIPEDQIDAMLQPFTRGETSRNRETGGAGLGLTLARAIAEQHGGTLTLSNRIGEDGGVDGLLAEIRIPLSA